VGLRESVVADQIADAERQGGIPGGSPGGIPGGIPGGSPGGSPGGQLLGLAGRQDRGTTNQRNDGHPLRPERVGQHGIGDLGMLYEHAFHLRPVGSLVVRGGPETEPCPDLLDQAGVTRCRLACTDRTLQTGASGRISRGAPLPLEP